MKNKIGLQTRQYFTAGITASLLFSFLPKPVAEAADAVPALPIYKTEEIAAPELEKRIRKNAERSGVRIEKYVPLAAENVRRTTRVRAQLQVQGTAEQVTKFLSAVGSQAEFHNISNVSIVVDRKDPDLVRTDFVVNAFYAKNEKVSRKIDRWKRSLTPNPPAMEIYAACCAGLEGERVRFTGFHLDGDSVRFSGEALNSQLANAFGGKLFQDEKLDVYDWVWEMRPKYNTKKKDGSVQFTIFGKRDASPKKKEKRKKE